jgi:DNA-binding XRE family transcriptional regulator
MAKQKRKKKQKQKKKRKQPVRLITDLAQVLREWRARWRWSQTEAADVLGVPARTYMEWERYRLPDHPDLIRNAIYWLDHVPSSFRWRSPGPYQ